MSKFTTAGNLRRHLTTQHGFSIPHRFSIERRRNSEIYIYVGEPPSSDVEIQQHCACPCCNDHFAELTSLNCHFFGAHYEYVGHQSQGESDQQDEENVPSSSLSVTPNSTGQKRNYDEALCLDGIIFDSPLGEHLFAKNFDVSNAFGAMKASLATNKSKLSLEDNLFLALSSTSILLLQPNKYPDEVQPFFSYDDWREASERIQLMFKIKRLPMPIATTMQFIEITDKLRSKSISRVGAVIRLKSLTLQAQEKKLAKAFAGMISKLPFVALDEDMHEMERCSRFVDPFLSGLFDDPDNGVYLRWTDETTLTATKSCGVKWGSSLAYGEAKPATQVDNHLVVNKDLVKVALLCKEALDNQLYEGMLGIQVIGRTVAFYVLTLPAQSLYTLIPLAQIELPDSLQDLPSFATETPSLLKVLDAFDRLCVPAAHPEVTRQRLAPTLTMSKILQLFSESKGCKRPCNLYLRYN
ncbi:hypothetical protein DM01DRAFT_1336912 [Hesseltinella vesiculosa]|uniref:C2H2-type domain-containing protein n=1 Tax=Hesseltinella vesiculosa TaxID=101127 RepID=A0A1X2GEB9_9FUNG|nr:hypothetical protein DM01DRAFT_1336912 [Hesseltinella vesiculosa]